MAKLAGVSNAHRQTVDMVDVMIKGKALNGVYEKPQSLES